MFVSNVYPDTLECLKRAGSILVVSDQMNYALDDHAMKTWPQAYTPFSFGLDRLSRLDIDSMVKAGCITEARPSCARRMKASSRP